MLNNKHIRCMALPSSTCKYFGSTLNTFIRIYYRSQLVPVGGPGEEGCYIFHIIFVFHPNIYNTAKNSKWKHHTSQGQRMGWHRIGAGQV